MNRVNTVNKLNLLATQVLLVVLFFSQPAMAESLVFVAPTFPETDVNLSDGQVADSWSQITSYGNLSEYGTGGFAKFAHNETHMFALLATSTQSWIAIEFDAETDCMLNGHDTWIIYVNTADKTIDLVDGTFKGTVLPEHDAQNDLIGEAIFTSDLTYIEVIRPFDTLDSSDIVFANGSSTFMTFASEEDHTSTRTMYYLNVQFTDVGSIAAIEAPDVTDWQKIQEYTLFGAMVFAVLFGLTHYIIRQKLRPLEHGSRIIDSTIHHPPKFKERWNTLVHGVRTVNVEDQSDGGAN
jgi:hypothetical protein